jgi:hypothetical protein
MPPTLEYRVLSHLSKGGAVATEIARQLKLEKTDVHSLLYTLRTAGKARVNAKQEWTLTAASAVALAKTAASAGVLRGSAPSRPMRTATTAPEIPTERKASRTNQSSGATAGTTGPSTTPAWTEEQKVIMYAPPEDRILVDAGPGTGKTATACARIAWLIADARLEPTDIWLVSFTRTAVHELKKRIVSYLGNPAAVAGLKIATIDTHAWAIHSGFDEAAKLNGTFDDNIRRVVKLVKSHEGVFEYLSSVRHLVVDEGQDVVGLRCELLLEIINALPHTSGVSVFSDEAQAIYGFAEDAAENTVEGTLPEKIREYLPDFRGHELTQIHRTADPTLLEVFGGGRKLVRNTQHAGANRLKGVRDLVTATNHADAGLYRDDIRGLPEELTDAFLLFRRRGEVLDASGYLGLRPHRLRMSGLPVTVHDWIAMIFWDWTAAHMLRAEFENRWRTRVGPSEVDSANAWASLVNAFGESDVRLAVTRMVTRLAGAAPPYELTTPEFGRSGPILGTIHGAKGREASEVRLYVPPPPSKKSTDEALEEEARILFVGATRAKSRLCVGRAASRAMPRRLEGRGRAFTPYPFAQGAPAARSAVEIGRDGDLDAVGLVGREFFSAKEALTAQQSVVALRARMTAASANSMAVAEWRYRICDDQGNPLGYLSGDVNRDLFAIAKVVNELVRLGKGLPPMGLKHLRSFGCRSMVLAPDDPMRERLNSPWRESGILIAPLILGYPLAYFRKGTSA